jgi:hypothetical protein
MTAKTLLCLAFILSLSSLAHGRALDPNTIPEALKPWQGWVLHGQEEQVRCIPEYSAADARHCIWPSRLDLEFLATGGAFRQQVTAYSDDLWLQLPGDQRFWPQGVTINDQPAVVVARDGLPFILAPQGELRIAGLFSWPGLPESFPLPPATGLIAATVEHAPMAQPLLDQEGRLWLASSAPTAEPQGEDSLALQVFRRIDDLIPPQIDIHLDIQAAGARREINLGALFPMDAFVPLTLSGTIPVKLEKNGDLLLQVRPGQWQVDLSLRHPGPMPELAFLFPTLPQWPEAEVWSFQDQPALRVVKIGGQPTAIDPGQTKVPEAWRQLPAYRVRSGEALTFSEIKRGEPEPPPDQLRLQRELWLNFDGQGYTLRDVITGSKHNHWRLNTLGPRLKLGRVTLDGQDQSITALDPGGAVGVELRQGEINLTAVSTLAQPVARIPATGYDTTFHSVAINLHLPPGFTLFNLTGVEGVSGTWVGAWTLLDLFLLSISTIACFKVLGSLPALVCFCTLLLLYHQPAAPLWGWLNIIAAVALLKVLPPGRISNMLALYKNVSLLLLVLVALPFMVTQIRYGLYPQLERPYQTMAVGGLEAEAPSAPVAEQQDQESASLESESMATADSVAPAAMMKSMRQAVAGGVAPAPVPSAQKQPELVDPAARVQTGPGLPTWEWQRIPIAFNGPVTTEQQLSIQVLPPLVNLVLALCRCLAILLLLAMLVAKRPWWRRGGKGVALLVLVLLPLLAPPPARAGEIPSPELLEELRTRLLAPAACFPHCVAIDAMTIRQQGDGLVIGLEVSAVEQSAMPLPGALSQWQPEEVRFVGQPGRRPELLRQNDTLWTVVAKGQSHIEILPRLDPQGRSLQINLPLIPHRLQSALTEWTLSGVDPSQPLPGSLTLDRKVEAEEEGGEQAPELRTGILPPFFAVERTLRFGLTWEVETSVRRVTPADSAMVVPLPLIPGEQVLTEGIAVQEGRADLAFAQDTMEIRFASRLEVQPQLTLTHAPTDLYAETWRIDPSSIWHIEYSGPPVISHQLAGRWLPTWQPWPGEAVTLTVTRPRAVAGPVLTIDWSRIQVEPGRTAANVALSFVLRASQGGQHAITIPQAVTAIHKFAINGRLYPLQKDQTGRLIIPVTPGRQEVSIEWTEATPVTMIHATPAIDLGLASVNSHLTLTLGHDRWPLALWGPRMGPAVLWWSTICITLLAAVGLGRMRWVPMAFHQWFLLGIGMVQTHLLLPVVFTVWLLALAKRKEFPRDLGPRAFNLSQLALAMLTLAALAALVAAISNGLLGYPDMEVIGNGSNNFTFQWYQDLALPVLPRGVVLSLPLWVYRVLMLAWALWVSFTLVRLLIWGFGCFATDRLWVSTPGWLFKGKGRGAGPTEPPAEG